MKKIFYFFLFVNIFINLFSNSSILFSQGEDSLSLIKNIKVCGYIDVYYAYDNDKNIFNSQRLLSLISPYRDQIRLNIAQVSAKYTSEKMRGTFILHYGDIPLANWTPVTKFDMIQEANIGYSPYKNLWIDAGYFVTHVGAEGLPKNNVLSSFSLPVFVEPFIQSGIKIGYDFSEKFFACLHVLNGYNVFEDNNKNKSLGMQLMYTPIETFKITYNNIIGNEMPAGTPGKTRVFNNLIFNISPHKKVDIIANFDLGIQEKSRFLDANATAYSYGSFISVRYKYTPKFSTTIRGEYYQDLDGILSGYISDYDNWLKGNAVTVGCEYKPVESSYVRFEYRYIKLDEQLKIFYNNSNQRSEEMFTIGYEF
jgi:opacity protein-like surface antigen